jgi:hypothetical protein
MHRRSVRASNGNACALRTLATAVVAAVLVVVAGCSSPVSSTSAGATTTSYFSSRFTATVNSHTFGQDPSWTADGRVLSNEKDGNGITQIYVSKLSGANMSCLTCGEAGPNGFPQERPQGDWILFCSFRGQTVTFGAPCLGGFGSDLYLMRPDGSHVTRVTSPGSPFESGDAPYDNYHPSWSPDGRQLIWTHVAYNPLARGGTQWTILLSSLAVDKSGRPQLHNVTVVAPGDDNAYETQVWAPDGSGVLYTSLSSGGDKRIGWLNSELHFLRLYGHGASPLHPRFTHLTDGNPGWDEQAVFTPDMRDVIWMSSRGSPTWYQTVVTAAQLAGYDPPLENDVVGPVFVLTVLDARFRTDLYELDLTTHAIRRLTNLHSVIPEFYFNPSGSKLIWTTGDRSHSYLGTFSPSPPRSIRAPMPPDPAWIGAPIHGDHAPPRPEQPTAIHLGHLVLPAQEIDAVSVMENQLAVLAHLVQGLPNGATCCHV